MSPSGAGVGTKWSKCVKEKEKESVCHVNRNKRQEQGSEQVGADDRAWVWKPQCCEGQSVWHCGSVLSYVYGSLGK